MTTQELAPNVYPDDCYPPRTDFQIHDYVMFWQNWIGPLLPNGQFCSKLEID